MRHGKKINHLSRTASHRKAMLSNMASSLILNKRIVTTVAKAKALKKYIEPIITKAKTDTTHSRRMVFRSLQNKESIITLFGDISEKVNDRAGGYTRILKTGNRLGDNASMCVIELVDYNEALLKDSKPKKSKARRSRRGGVAKKAAGAAVATEVADKAVEVDETQVAEAEEVVEEAVAAEEATESMVGEELTEAEETAGEEIADEEKSKPVAEEGPEETADQSGEEE